MSHIRPISLSFGASATAAMTLLLSACADLAIPSNTMSTIAELLILSQQTNAPIPAARNFWVYNSEQSIERINHPDNFNTLYLELTFPAQSLVSHNGTQLSTDDSVLVTITPRSDSYGFTLSPAGIVFSSGSSPTATFSFSVYGDASAVNTSSTYSSTSEFVAALEIWREITVDQWQVAPSSGSAGVDAIEASIVSSGQFVLAAPG